MYNVRGLHYLLGPDEEVVVRAGYEILSLVSKGSWATMLKVRRMEDGLECALKLVAEERMTGEVFELLENEIDAMSALSGHPNIVELYEVIRVPRGVMIVMEWLDGGTLRDSIDTIRSEADMVFVACEVINALSHISSQNFAYRNVRLENIMLEKRRKTGEKLPRLKLIDFAFATRTRGANHRLTRQVGCPAHFLSPERAIGHSYDAEKSDIWSVGVLLYLMASGSYPFDGATDQQIANSISSGVSKPCFDKTVWNGISGGYKCLVKGMLRRKEASRCSLVQASQCLGAILRSTGRRTSRCDISRDSGSDASSLRRRTHLSRRFSGSSTISSSPSEESWRCSTESGDGPQRRSSLLARAKSSLIPTSIIRTMSSSNSNNIH